VKASCRAAPAVLFSLALATLGCGRETPLNLLVMTLDTTRADHLGCYGYGRIQTPAIDGLAAEGTLYENAVTAVPITLPSHLTIFTGLYPVRHGVHENAGFYVAPESQTLAKLLRARGWQTAAFVGAFPLDHQTGIDQGFDLYDDNYQSSSSAGKHPSLRAYYDERPAAEVAAGAVAWLEEHGGKPFFLWTHFFDPHQPQRPPSPYRERYADSPYDGEIASVDEAIGHILEVLRRRGLLDRTLVVLVADHGESLGEHGEMSHAVLLYSATLRVPLIVRDPRDLAPRRVRTLVGTVDIFPTVLARLGLEVPAGCQGKELPRENAAAPAHREVYGESLYGSLLYGWSPLERLASDSWAYLRGPKREWLFDLSSDPAELEDLAPSRPDLVAALRARTRELRQELAPEGVQFSEGTVSAETRDRLAALGYVGAPTPGAARRFEPDPSRLDPHDMMDVLGMIMEGRQLAEAGVNELAIPVLERALARDPNNGWAIRQLALSYIAYGDLERARTAVIRLQAVDTEHAWTQLVLAEYERAAGRSEAACAHLTRAVELDPRNLATRLLRTHLLEDLGRVKEAETAYRGLLADEPGDPLVTNGLAALLLTEQRVEEGVALLRSLLSSQPFFPPAYLNLAVVEHDSGNFDESLRLVRHALRLRPGQVKAVELEAMDLEALGARAEATKAWGQVARMAEDEATQERARAALGRLKSTSG
jgi:choline-sulfatase